MKQTALSKQAYLNPDYKDSRMSIKSKILHVIRYHYPITSDKVAEKLDLKIEQALPRISDLKREGRIEALPVRVGNKYSYWRPCNRPEMLTTSEAFKEAIDQICPMFKESILSHVNSRTV
jgi:predicted ArsR family transcriptional regulator